MEQAKAINRALVATLDGDTQVINPGHLLRLPGTVNIPNQKKAGRGRVPAPTTLLAENSACWPVSSFDTQSISENAPKPKLTIEPTLVDGLEDLEQFYLPERLVQIIEHGRVPGESKEADDSRSAWLFDLVCGLVRRRVPNDIIAGVMLNPDFAISESVLEREDHDQHRYVVHSIENAHKVVKDSRLAAARRDFDDVDDEVLEKLAAADEAATARNVDSNEPDNRPEKPHRFKLYTLAELGALPPVQWLVDGLVVERGLTLIYGPTKQFKTFISIAMALSIATGRDFYGLPVKRGQVVYVIGEGQSDFYNRAKAWCIANDVDLEDLTDWFRVVINPVYVDEEVVVEEFVKVAEEAAPFDAVFVDTLNRNMSGDENSTADMSRFIKGCGVVQRRFRAAVIPIHHTGHNESRSRGSSSLVAAVDASLRVSRVDKKSKLTRLLAEHVRAGPNGLELFFEPESITTDINSTRDTLVMKQVDPPRKDGDQSDGGLNWSTADKVLVEIANLKPTTQAILVRDVRGRSQQNISKIVKALQDEGFLQEGSLALTEAGAAKAKELNRQRHEAAVADFPDDLPEVAEDEEND